MYKKCYFYGIKGVELVSHGSWADPELVWEGNSFNYYDVENALWDSYKEICAEENKPANETRFDKWVKKNAYLTFEYLQNLKDYNVFYGARG